MRLINRVIMRKGMKNKSHNHVQKLRAFSKGRTKSELTITPIEWTLTKSRNELLFGHSPQTLTMGGSQDVLPSGHGVHRIQYLV